MLLSKENIIYIAKGWESVPLFTILPSQLWTIHAAIIKNYNIGKVQFLKRVFFAGGYVMFGCSGAFP